MHADFHVKPLNEKIVEFEALNIQLLKDFNRSIALKELNVSETHFSKMLSPKFLFSKNRLSLFQINLIINKYFQF